MTTPRAVLTALAAVLLAGANARATPEEAVPLPSGLAALALGVAPFETQAPPGTGVPDVAALLASRLAGGGLGRVLGPAELPAANGDAGPAEAALRWAAEADLDAVVVGRTTRIGEALSLDVQLLRGADGGVARTLVAEAPNPQGLGAAADQLAAQLLEGVALLATPSPPEAPAAEPAGSTPAGAPFGFSTSEGPLEINSDELEAREQGGARTLVFRKNVQAVQGDFRLRCQRLEAAYPAGSSQPSRLLASGDVVLTQGAQKAWCDEAEYQRSAALLVCRGNGRFRDGDNELRGSEIEIDLRSESVKVRGGAQIVIEQDAPPPVSAP